ncbi:2-oxo acid dehydrogenase subunit E2, partial [Staphylococcus aureus]
ITKSDVDGFLATPIVAPVAQPAVTSAPSINVAKPTIPAAPAGVVSFDDVPVSQMRKVIARRLSESLFTAPHFFLTMRIDMD